MRTPLIAGNWKMHKTLAEARELVKGIREGLRDDTGFKPVPHVDVPHVDVLICPPFPWLLPMAEAVKGSRIMLGAQNAHEASHGAFTGEVSVSMLVDAGCTHVIIGHSERRHIFGETGPLLAKKVRAVIDGRLEVIYCIGETLEQREAGQTQAVVEQQITEVIGTDVPADRLIVAYEPVWAIGTGRNATPEQAQEVHALVRSKLAATYDRAAADSIRILYGGSVKPNNAEGLLPQPDVDGALVGGACLVAADFLAIIGAAESVVSATR